MALPRSAAAVFTILLAVLLSNAPADDLAGKTITRILLKDDHGAAWTDPGEVLPLIVVRTGEPLSREAVRRGVIYLYLKNQFRDIRVEAFPEDGGVRLEYTFVPLTRIDEVVLRGNHSLSDRAVRDAIGNVVGKELREEDFPDMRADIQARYNAEGFYNVRVDFLPRPAAHPYRVTLFVYITETKRTIIEEVRFTGNKIFTAEQLTSVMINEKGAPLLTDVLMGKDLAAIQEKYAEAGYPAARPGPVSISFQDGKAFLEVAGDEGPRLTVSFSGNHAFSDRTLKKMLLFRSEHDVADTVIDSSADKIRTAYHERGYVDAAVDVEKKAGPGSLDLAFRITEGPRVTVEDIRVSGCRAFTPKQVRKMMATRSSGWFRSGVFRQDILDNDVDAITDQYAAAGYLAATVKPEVTRSADGRRAVIELSITEGVRTVTGSVSFEGATVFTKDELAAAVKLKSGDPFSDRMVEEDRYRILALYAGRGYLYARVEAEKTTVPAPRKGGDASVDIRFRIEEDHQVVIGTVILRGNVTTRDPVILRELEPRRGEPYNYEALLKSQQRIYRYGYFSLAKFEPVHVAEKEYVKDMLFTVEERPAGAVEFGFGYGDLDRLRGFAEVSHRNLWGIADYASLRLEGSDILRRSVFTYKHPWFLGFRNLDSTLLLSWSDSKRINQDTREVYYQTRKTTASYGPEYTHGRVKTSLTYQFENVKNYHVEPAAELSPEDSGRVLISSLNPSILWDLRDDPFNPHRGSIHGANLKEATVLLGSEADFTKATVQTSWFLPAADFAVVALSGRGGMAWQHRDTPEVPIHERFYLGGGTTVRGYTQDSIGPATVDSSGNRVPTGGSSMVQLNAELRLMAPGGSGFVLFTDAGNVWVDQRIRLDDLRASYGAGFRYQTPVGPLRIDYGQKIHRRPGESPGELHFNIGHAF